MDRVELTRLAKLRATVDKFAILDLLLLLLRQSFDVVYLTFFINKYRFDKSKLSKGGFFVSIEDRDIKLPNGEVSS